MESVNGGYKIKNQSAIHFITFAVVDWVDVFTRKNYSNIVVDSLRYCQQHKGLKLHCWCIMSNHLHFIASASDHNLSDVLRDFKTHTSKKVVSAITSNPSESRREWMLSIFRKRGQQNSRNWNHQFWQQDNHPKELYSAEFVAQKINYIHSNPVEAGIVYRAEDYIYSSERDYKVPERCGLLDVAFI